LAYFIPATNLLFFLQLYLSQKKAAIREYERDKKGQNGDMQERNKI